MAAWALIDWICPGVSPNTRWDHEPTARTPGSYNRLADPTIRARKATCLAFLEAWLRRCINFTVDLFFSCRSHGPQISSCRVQLDMQPCRPETGGQLTSK
eukprot:644862-Pyramimonas_sp.AAC.1